MVNVTELLVDKDIPIAKDNCPTLDWFIHIKTEPLSELEIDLQNYKGVSIC